MPKQKKNQANIINAAALIFGLIVLVVSLPNMVLTYKQLTPWPFTAVVTFIAQVVLLVGIALAAKRLRTVVGHL